MVRRENELRLSREWQERFAAAERSPDRDWLDCVAELQQQVMREFGWPASAVKFLQTACSIYPDEPFFKEEPLYVKYNRARNGPLSVGSKTPDVRVVHLDGRRASLSWHGGEGQRPLVVIGGSRS